MTRIALISDLHVGSSRAGDLNPIETGSELTGRYLEEFGDLAQILTNQSPVDHLMVTGDITNRATKEEVAHSALVISNIADALQVPEENVFWVPGNHDRCWSLIEAHGDTAYAYGFFVEATKIDATYKNGTFTILLPKNKGISSEPKTLNVKFLD